MFREIKRKGMRKVIVMPNGDKMPSCLQCGNICHWNSANECKQCHGFLCFLCIMKSKTCQFCQIKYLY